MVCLNLKQSDKRGKTGIKKVIERNKTKNSSPRHRRGQKQKTPFEDTQGVFWYNLNMKKLILASISATRKKLLTDAGLVFETDSGDYQEDMSLPMSPKDLVKHLSRGKAESVIGKHKDAIVIGADVVAVY